LQSGEINLRLGLRDATVEKSAATWFAEALAALAEHRNLSDQQIRAIFEDIISGGSSELETAVFLVALRMKGETAGEIAAAAQVLRQHMVRFETGRRDTLDTCGTGGDGSSTFNISTATALVAAGAGVPVVKHGNRAVSSSSGSVDVLAALGIAVREDMAWVRRCLDRAGLAFCFAQHFHPALRHVAPVRRRLRIRTIFNCLGPLINPAGAAYQLLGVGRPEMLDPMAGALAQLGIRRALLVCGADGVDEVSLWGPSRVREVVGNKVVAHEWLPRDFGLAPCTLAELVAQSPQESAALIKAALAGEEGPAARVIVANSSAALLAAERVTTLAEGVARAGDVIRSGRALRVLTELVACSQD
jgi:anthranilate phosphoribosyltransferase